MSLNDRFSGTQKRKAKNIRLAEYNKLCGLLDKYYTIIEKTALINTGN